MRDHAKGSDRHLDLVTMGCRWVLDLSALEDSEAQEMADRWHRCRELASSTTPILDDAPTTITARSPAAPYDLSREVTRKGLTRLTGRATLLHAAALADEGGRALVLVAPSGGGKSTATRVLGRRLGYVSDESVILLEDQRIAPHPKPPSLVVDPARRFRKEEPAPDDIGLGPTPAAPRLGRLITLARDPDVTEPAILPIGLIDQVLTVLPETSSTWLVPDGLDRLARAVTAGGPPARLHYAEAETCHDLVREHLAAPATPAPTWEHIPPLPTPHLPRQMRSDERLGDRLARAPWSDAIAHDGEVLVLAGPTPLRLAGPGAVLWRAAGDGRSVDALTDDVVTALGDHPDARAIVREAADELLRHGALRRALP